MRDLYCSASKCALFRSHISVFAGAIKVTKTRIIEEKYTHARFARNILNCLRVDHVEETTKTYFAASCFISFGSTVWKHCIMIYTGKYVHLISNTFVEKLLWCSKQCLQYFCTSLSKYLTLSSNSRGACLHKLANWNKSHVQPFPSHTQNAFMGKAGPLGKPSESIHATYGKNIIAQPAGSTPPHWKTSYGN